MNDINKWIGTARLTSDPQQKHLQSGSTVTEFPVAVNRGFTKHGGEKVDEVSYLNCVAFGKLGENVNRYCEKGKQVIIEGRLKQGRWTDSDGKSRSTVRIICDAVQFLGKNAERFTNDDQTGSAEHTDGQEEGYPF